MFVYLMFALCDWRAMSFEDSFGATLNAQKCRFKLIVFVDMANIWLPTKFEWKFFSLLLEFFERMCLRIDWCDCIWLRQRHQANNARFWLYLAVESITVVNIECRCFFSQSKKKEKPLGLSSHFPENSRMFEPMWVQIAHLNRASHIIRLSIEVEKYLCCLVENMHRKKTWC